MKRIDTANYVPNMFGTGKNGFRDSFDSLRVHGTVADASFFNAVQEEIAQLIESTGASLDPNSHVQLLSAVQTLINGIYQRDTAGNVTGLIGPVTGTLALNLQKASLAPYECAFWGDNRYNAFSGTTPECIGSGTTFSNSKTPTWTIAHMGDAEFSRSYAVSGDSASAWASMARANGKTYLDMIRSDSQVVFIQLGVNDCIGLTAAATTAANLQALIVEMFKAGKYVVFESINPVNSPVANYAAVQALIDSVNSLMYTWLSNYRSQALYVDTTILLKAPNGLANMNIGFYATDGVQLTKLGSYYTGKTIATAVRALLPKKIGMFGSGPETQNYINLTSPAPITTQFYNVSVGVATVTQAQGNDSRGYYYEWTITPTSLGGTAGDMWRVTMQMTANFQTASPPYTSLAGNEVIQGAARLVVDDGANGVPLIYNVILRQVHQTNAIFADWSSVTSTSLNEVNFTEKLDFRGVTPKLINTAASVVANPASGTGLACVAMVEGKSPGTTVRVRVYMPQVHRVKYITTPLTAAGFALPASGVDYTNNSFTEQQVTVGGGTVSAIALGGVATGLTSGAFILSPGDTITVSYTVAPTWTVKQVFTESMEVV